MLKSERTTLNRCADVRALLPELVENELSESARARVAGHLAGCRACREEESRYRAALSALADARAPHPGDLYAGFSRKLALGDARSFRLGRQMRLAGATCALLLVVGIVGAQVASHLIGQKPAEIVAQTAPTLNPVPIVRKAAPPTKNAIDHAQSIVLEPGTRITMPKEQADTPAAEHKPTVHRTHVHPDSDFLHVTDASGKSVLDRIKERRSNSTASGSSATPSAMATDTSGVNAMIPSQDALVRVGDSKALRVKSSYREDANGNRTEIHVSISAPEKTP